MWNYTSWDKSVDEKKKSVKLTQFMEKIINEFHLRHAGNKWSGPSVHVRNRLDMLGLEYVYYSIPCFCDFDDIKDWDPEIYDCFWEWADYYSDYDEAYYVVKQGDESAIIVVVCDTTEVV